MGARVRDGASELGLEMQCPALERYAWTVTAIALPPHLTPAAVRDGLKSRGIFTAGGLGKFQPSGFRIGHMGDTRLDDVERTLAALRDVLASLPAVANTSAVLA